MQIIYNNMHRLFTPFLLGLIFMQITNTAINLAFATSLYFNHLQCQYWSIISFINDYAADGWNVSQFQKIYCIKGIT